MLNVSSIDVFHGKFQALWNVSFRVEKGEMVAIVGANSAGKSTILRSVSGVLRPKRGSIEFLGDRLEHLQPYVIARKGLCQVPEGRRLFPYMTVIDNLKAGAYAGEAARKYDESLEEVFSLFPILKERTSQTANTLSGGEQQMLAIARALMSQPETDHARRAFARFGSNRYRENL